MKEKFLNILKFFNLDKSNKIDNKNYILSFDGLRAIAVIFVTLYHLVPHIFSGGYLGVVIFLVMSGYLVTDNFIKEIDRTRYLDILHFWKKRLIKLYIPLLPMLSVVSLVILLFYHDMLKGYFGNLMSSLFGVNNIYQIVNGLSYFESHGVLNPFTHLWSLGLEIQFYFIWPIIITLMYNTFRLNKKTMAIIIFIMSLMSAFWMYYLYSPDVDVSRIYYGADTRAFGFLVGSVFALIFPRKNIQKLKLTTFKSILMNLLTIIVFSIMIYALIYLDPKLDIVYKFGMYAFSIIVAILTVLLLIKSNIIGKILSTLPFTLIGRRSYSLYLWQYPAMLFIGSMFTFSKISKLTVFSLELLVAIILAEISYRVFEKQKKYLRYLTKKDELYDRTLTISMVLLASFVIFSTSLTSLYKNISNTDELKNKIEQIEKNSKEDENKDTENVDVTSDVKYTFIGDSIMLSAKENIEKEFENSVVDAKISRQSWHLEEVLNDLKTKNQIYDTVIIHLGTNYKINKSKYVEVLKIISDKNVYLINCVVPESWEEQVNSTIKEIAEEHSNIQVIDWYSLAKGEKEWFYTDATHPNDIGVEEYIKLIKNTVNKK